MTALVRCVIVASLVLASSVAAAQTIYRCGHEYSRDPFPSARAIDV